MRSLRSPLLPVLFAVVGFAVGCRVWFEADQPNLPDGQFIQMACLDTNSDQRLSAADGDALAGHPLAAALGSVDIALATPAADCADGGAEPELQVNAPTVAPAFDCAAAQPPVLLIGVGGGAVNMRDETNAAGVRSLLSELQSAFTDIGVQTQAIAAAPDVHGATEPFPAMEELLAAIARANLDGYSCLRVVLTGHSYGGVSTTAVAAALERDGYGGRILVSVPVDRVTAFYDGDVDSLPQQSAVLNVYETTDATLPGAPIEQPNVENWDASGERGPKNGEKGGSSQPVNHTIIDNSQSVWDRVVAEVLERYTGAAPATS